MTARDQRAALGVLLALIGGAIMLVDFITGWRIPPEYR